MLGYNSGLSELGNGQTQNLDFCSKPIYVNLKQNY